MLATGAVLRQYPSDAAIGYPSYAAIGKESQILNHYTAVGKEP